MVSDVAPITDDINVIHIEINDTANVFEKYEEMGGKMFVQNGVLSHEPTNKSLWQEKVKNAKTLDEIKNLILERP